MSKVEYLTNAYIESYNIAFEKTHNPIFAVQAAAIVLMSLQNEQMRVHQADAIGAMLAMMAAGMNGQKKDPMKSDKKKDGDDNEGESN